MTDREQTQAAPNAIHLRTPVAASSYYFGSGTRRHEVSHMTDNWATMWCGIGGRTSGPAVKVRSSRVEPNCRACARAKARNLANA